MMLKNKWFKFSLVLFLLPLVCILVTYNKLPAQVATHFDFNGTPDGYMDKFLGLYGLWGFMLVLHIFCTFMTFKDPKKSNIPDIGLRIVFMICPVICLMVTLVIITYSLGYRFDISLIVNIVIGLIFIILGNYLPKIKRNYTIGIRTSWALNSDENWSRTHRFSGYVFVVTGMLYIIFSMLGYMYIGLGIVMISGLLCFGYSYNLYRKGI